MRHLVRASSGLVVRFSMAAASLTLLASLTACGRAQQTTAQAPPAAAATTPQRAFASPEEAGEALLAAAKAGDESALVAIVGPEDKTLVVSGDAVKDRGVMQDFVAAYEQMHRWRRIKAGGQMLTIGADNFLFPIPLDRNSTGQWQFDTAAGKDEILARRIGRDELVAISACAAIAGAQQQYFSQTHSYAQKLISDEGQKNGLYWPVTAGQAPSPLEGLRDFAQAAGYANAGTAPQPFDGYYFRILTKQGGGVKGGSRDYIANGKMTGGFAVLAYPAQYRDSGIMTFEVGTDGVVYQKDMGENTTVAAQALTEYDLADGWNPAT
jgi:hypothetical protein